MMTVGKVCRVGERLVLSIDGLSTDEEPKNPEGIEGFKLTNGSVLHLMDSGVVKNLMRIITNFFDYLNVGGDNYWMLKHYNWLKTIQESH